MYVIETDRLRLRQMNKEDFEDLKLILSNPQTMKYYQKPYDDNGVNRWIAWCLACYEKRGFGLWAINLKDDTRLIGDCGITLQNIDNEEVFEIGYHINKDYWYNGYGIEAAKAVKKWYFENTDNDEVYSYMNFENTASRNVAEKNGMMFVKEYYNDDNEHLAVYKITRQMYLDSLQEFHKQGVSMEEKINTKTNTVELNEEDTEKISGGSVVFVVDDNAPGPGSYAPNLYENQTNKEFENPYKK